MKSVISTTYDSKYLYFLPLTVWAWNKLGVDVICFMPQAFRDGKQNEDCLGKIDLINRVIEEQNLSVSLWAFECPKNKESTYAQCSRLYGACLDLPEDEVLVTSDIDMLLFQKPPYLDEDGEGFTIFGNDLTPKGQIPMCYISAKVSQWRKYFNLDGKTYQQCLDETIGKEECENMRGNLWSRDQETAFNKIIPYAGIYLEPRAKEGTQFASKRYDRDDAYILDRLSPDTIDYHMNRSGYEYQSFEIIIKVLQYHYPNEGFQWLIDYTNKYRELL